LEANLRRLVKGSYLLDQLEDWLNEDSTS